MIDFTSQKVLVPAALFALLSPGLLLSLPSLDIASMKTNRIAILLHALVFIILYALIAKVGLLKTSITKWDLIIPAILFAVLSPPGSTTNGLKISISTLLFIVIYTILRSKFPQYY